MRIEIVSNSEGDTRRLASIIGKNCFRGFVVSFSGELGAGKTFLAKGIGEVLGVKQTINSPTFNILKCYEGVEYPFYHIDAYRLEGVKQDLGLEEYIEGDGVCLIEWASFIDYLLPKEYLSINISILSEDSRLIVVESFGSKYDKVIEEIREVWK